MLCASENRNEQTARSRLVAALLLSRPGLVELFLLSNYKASGLIGACKPVRLMDPICLSGVSFDGSYSFVGLSHCASALALAFVGYDVVAHLRLR